MKNLEDQLTNIPILEYFESNKTTVLYVDVSKNGLGAVIMQYLRPIVYGSTSLSNSQCKYSQIERKYYLFYIVLIDSVCMEQILLWKQITTRCFH